MALFRSAAILVAMSVVAPSAFGQLIIGHRGASHDAPENTLAAFKLAIEQGADGFEGDFYLASDGQILCLHDKDTQRVAGKKLLVTESPFAELRALDVGSWKGPEWRGERMPTLKEILEILPPGKKFFIELKSGAEVVAPLAKVLDTTSAPPEQLVIISFHEKAVAECKRLMPHIKALWLCGFKQKKDEPPPPTADEVAATLRRIHADGVGCEAVPEYVDAEFLKRLHELGCKEFSVWTVDDPKIAQFYKQLGAWSITTNRPAWLREKLWSTAIKVSHDQPRNH